MILQRAHPPNHVAALIFAGDSPIIKWQNEPKFNVKQPHIYFRVIRAFIEPVELAFDERTPDARSVRASATRGGRE